MTHTIGSVIGAIIIMAIIIIVIILVATALSNWVIYGQDIDPRYYCIYKNVYPFSELCNDQRIESIMNDLLEISKGFNNCEYDESFCVLGIPDPDFKE